MTTTHFTRGAKELDARTAEGIDVHLFWQPASGTVSIGVFDSTNEQAFELVVDPAEALDAFHHPFAYAAFRGVPFHTPARAHNGQPIAA